MSNVKLSVLTQQCMAILTIVSMSIIYDRVHVFYVLSHTEDRIIVYNLVTTLQPFHKVMATFCNFT